MRYVFDIPFARAILMWLCLLLMQQKVSKSQI